MNNYPAFDEIRLKRDAEMATLEDTRRPLMPICRDILADMETPVSAYCKVTRGAYSFLLESVEGGEHIARYSFIGIDPYLVMTHRDEKATLRWMKGGHYVSGNGRDACNMEEIPCHDPLAFIATELGQYRLVSPIGITRDELPRFHGGAVGYLAYEAVARFEHLSVPEKDVLELLFAVFCFIETVLIFYHLKYPVKIFIFLYF